MITHGILGNVTHPVQHIRDSDKYHRRLRGLTVTHHTPSLSHPPHYFSLNSAPQSLIDQTFLHHESRKCQAQHVK